MLTIDTLETKIIELENLELIGFLQYDRFIKGDENARLVTISCILQNILEM